MTYKAKHKRNNFPKPVQRAALERSGGFCECTGPAYGKARGERCNAPLSKGVNFEHVIADSIGGKPTLANCLAACPSCNLYKADKIDKPVAAKTKRQSDKHHGIKKPKASIQSAGFQKRDREKASGNVLGLKQRSDAQLAAIGNKMRVNK